MRSLRLGRLVLATALATLFLGSGIAQASTDSTESVDDARAQLERSWAQEPKATATMATCTIPPYDETWGCDQFSNSAGAFVKVFKKSDPAVQAGTRIIYSSGEVRSHSETDRDFTNHAVAIGGLSVLSSPCHADISPCIEDVRSAGSGDRVELAVYVTGTVTGNHLFVVA